MKVAPIDGGQRPSLKRIVLLLILVLVMLIQLVGAYVLKQNNWGEDGMVMDTRTGAWSAGRQYLSVIEAGLAILNQYEPRQVAYLRSRGNPIEFIPCTKGRRGYTSIPEGVVHVCQQFRYDPAEVAVVLSHEIVHLERHDPDIRPREHPLLQRFFGYTEEQKAHWQNVKIAWRLWPEHHSVWSVLGWEWFLDVFCWVWPTPVAILEFPLFITLFIMLILDLDRLWSLWKQKKL